MSLNSIFHLVNQEQNSFNTEVGIDSTNRYNSIQNSDSNSKKQIKAYSNKSLYNNLLDVYKESNLLNEECYIIDKQVVKVNVNPNTVFTSTLPHAAKNNWIHPKELSRNTGSDFLIIPVVVGLFIFVAILIRYSKYLTKFLEGLVYEYVVEKFVSDINIPTQRLLLLIDLLSLITLSFLSVQLFSVVGFTLDSKSSSSMLFLFVFMGLLAYRIYSYVIHKVTEVLTYTKSFTSNLYFDSLIAIRGAGFILFPLSVIIFYINKPISEYFLYFAIAAFGLLFLYRLFRLISLFISNSISLLYFILYLCALEIVPIFILYVELQRI